MNEYDCLSLTYIYTFNRLPPDKMSGISLINNLPTMATPHIF